MSYVRPNIVSGATRLTKELVDDITKGIEDAHEELDGRLSETELNGTYATPSAVAKLARPVVVAATPVRIEAAIPAVMSSPPTVTMTETGGAANPIASGVLLPWNTPLVTPVGARPLTSYVQSTNTYGEVVNGLDGGTPVTAYEFDYYGADLAFRFHHRNTSVRIWVFVDGQAVTAVPDTPAGSASGYQKWYQLTFSGSKWRRIRVVYDGGIGFSGVSIGPTDAVLPSVLPPFKVAVLGDSWIANTAGGNASSLGYVQQAGRMLGLAIMNFGQGGTGYIATPGSPAGRKVYGSAERVASLVASNPDYIIIAGSINDADDAAVGTAAAALYVQLATSLPNAKLIVSGPQRRGTTPPAKDIANRDRIAAAAAAAPNVVAFIDPIADNVIMGTGRVGATAGDGVADVAMQNDGAHLTDSVGNGIYARWFARKLADIFGGA